MFMKNSFEKNFFDLWLFESVDMEPLDTES